MRSIPDFEQRNGLDVDHPRYVVVPKLGMNLTPHTLYRAMRRRLRQMLDAGLKIDLIDAHYFYPDGVAATWLGAEFNLPVVITARGTDINLIPEYPRPRRLILEAAQNAAALITVCQALKDRLVELGAPESKITVLRNGVDLEKFHVKDREVLRSQFGVTGLVLASVGLLIERKGQHLIIEALKRFRATLLLAGSDPIARSWKTFGATGCRIVSASWAVSTRKSLRHLQRRRYLHPGLERGLGNVLLESMACGTPVWVRRCGTPK